MAAQEGSTDPNDRQSGITAPSSTSHPLKWWGLFKTSLRWLINLFSIMGRGISSLVSYLRPPLLWLINLISVVIIGGGIGWLLGLSVSPVVASIVAVVIAAAATLVAVMGGWEKSEGKANKSETAGNANGNENILNAQNAEVSQEQSPNKQPILSRFTHIVTPLPFAMLMVGIVAGSIAGLYARNHSWFGSNLSYEVEKWAAQGLPKDEVVRRLFELEYPYTPYVQPWLRITNTVPISSAIPLTMSQLAVSNPISAEVKIWEDLGLDRTQVISRFFELKYPVNGNAQLSLEPNSGSTSTSEKNNNAGTVLYAVDSTECGILRTTPERNLRKIVSESSIVEFQELPKAITDTTVLKEVIRVLCTH